VPLPGLWQAVAHIPTLDAKAQYEVTLLLGAEREGLPEEVVNWADVMSHIPTANDSLNVAMAASVALYELATRMPAA
jgi:TrmH family RNA methyltransferase